MKRFIIIVGLLLIAVSSMAQTPVQGLIDKYKGSSGASFNEASGLELFFARPILKASPLAPVVSDIEQIAILRMGNVSVKIKDAFIKDLYTVLRSYSPYGERQSPNGTVRVFAKVNRDGHISELVIFNPGQCILNDVCGDFTVASLEKIK